MQKPESIKNLLCKKYSNIFDGVNPENLSIEEIFDITVKYFESIINCMPGNVYWLDKDSKVVGCNENVLKNFGFKHVDSMKGLTFQDMGEIAHWPLETTMSFANDTLEVIQTKKAKLNIEEPPIPSFDGGLIHFLTSRVPLFNKNGDVIGIVGVSTDITERKKMEVNLLKEKKKAEIANLAKTEFLENMRHDIRTPLVGIIGFSELLQDITDPNTLNEYTTLLAQSCKELLRFLNEVLESIHVASGEIPLLKKKFSLRDVVGKLVTLNSPKAKDKKITLNIIGDDKIPKYVIGDPVRIYRIILELLVNALKFTPHSGHIDISLQLAKKTNNNLIVKLIVADNGPGIPVDRQQELFMRFKRLVPSYQGIYKGSGLGLSIVKQFIDDLEGEIYIESLPAKSGTKFICLLPLKAALLNDAEGI